MAESEPDTIAEPDTVSGETPASEPDAMPADPVADVEPDHVPATEGAGLLGHRGKSKVWAGEYDRYLRITTAAPAEVLKGDYIIIESGRQDPDVLRVVEPAHSDGGVLGQGQRSARHRRNQDGNRTCSKSTVTPTTTAMADVEDRASGRAGGGHRTSRGYGL